MGGDNKGAVSKDKKTKKELKEERSKEKKNETDINKLNAKAIAEAELEAGRLRRERQEALEAEKKDELSDIDELIKALMRGDIDISSVSIRLYDKLQKSVKLRKSFLETPQGQMMAAKAIEAVKSNQELYAAPQAGPLLTFLSHVAAGEVKAVVKEDSREAKEKLEKDGWVFIEKKYKTAPKTITVEEGKKEQEEAMEAVRKLHKSLGAKSPEEIKKEQQQNSPKGMI